MQLRIADHSLISYKLTLLRSKDMPSPVFRQLTDELTTLLTYESTREVHTEEAEIEIPLTKTTGREPASPDLVVIPTLRAGLRMLEGVTRLLSTIEMGFLGMKRDEQTLAIETYANRLPQGLSGRQCFLADPMLATGGALVAAINHALEHGARNVTCICLLAAPEGTAAVKDATGNCAEVRVVVGGVNNRLNENAYTVPGLGDVGDHPYDLV